MMETHTEAVDDMIELAYVLAKRRKVTSKDVMPYECCITAAQTRWSVTPWKLSSLHYIPTYSAPIC